MLIFYGRCNLREGRVRGTAKWGNSGENQYKRMHNQAGHSFETAGYLVSHNVSREAIGNYCTENSFSRRRWNNLSTGSSRLLSLTDCCPSSCDLHNTSGLCTWLFGQPQRQPGALEGGLPWSSVLHWALWCGEESKGAGNNVTSH